MKKIILCILTIFSLFYLFACNQGEPEVKIHKHIFDLKVVTDEYLKSEATCTKKSVYYFSCECGEKGTETFEYGKVLGHSFTNYISNNDSDHFHDGTKTAKCDRCDATDTLIEENTMIPHTFNLEVVKDEYLYSEATCLEKAVYYYSCECGKKGTETFECGEPLGHSFTNYISNNDATHFRDGTKTAKCDRCDETNTVTDEGSKIPHTFDIENPTDKYLLTKATCVNPAVYYYSCECGAFGTETYEYGEPLGHSFTHYTTNFDATHFHDGTKTAKCDRCNETNTIIDIGSMIPHTFDQKTPTSLYLATPATCTEPATYYYSCDCGEKGTETYSYGTQLGHEFIDYVSNNDATHFANGTKTAVCQRCGIEDTIMDPGTKIPHTFDKQVVSSEYLATNATCTDCAKYYYSCECGARGNDTFEYGESLGHSFTKYVSNKDATHFHDGTKTAKCDRCNETNTVDDPGSMIPHSFECMITTDKYLKTKATCTEKAVYYYSCSCGEKGTETFTYGSTTEHVVSNYHSNNDATHFHDGTKTGYCDNCGLSITVTDVGSMIPHTYNCKVANSNYLYKEATCTDCAQYYYSCECGVKGMEIFAYGDPLGHDLENGRIVTLGERHISNCARCKHSIYVDNNKTNHDITKMYFSTKMLQSFNDFSNSSNLKCYYYDVLINLLDFHFGNKDVTNTVTDTIYGYAYTANYSSYSLSTQEGLAVWSAIEADWPIFYWLSNTAYYNSLSVSFMTDDLYFSGNVRKETSKKIEDGINTFLENIKDLKSVAEIIKYAHDFIIKNTNYAYDENGEPSQVLSAHNIAGFFTKQNIVCEGYAKTFQILMNACGIDCYYVSGVVSTGSHAWNYVYVNNGWYFIDVTWDDYDDVIARAYVKYNDYVIQISMSNSDDFITDKQYKDFIAIINTIEFK